MKRPYFFKQDHPSFGNHLGFQLRTEIVSHLLTSILKTLICLNYVLTAILQQLSMYLKPKTLIYIKKNERASTEKLKYDCNPNMFSNMSLILHLLMKIKQVWVVHVLTKPYRKAKDGGVGHEAGGCIRRVKAKLW